jgi:hypothetical protein
MPTERRPNNPTPSKFFTKRRSLRGLLLIAFIAMMAAASNVCAQDSPNTEFGIPGTSAFRGNPAGLTWTIVLVGVLTASFLQWAKELWGWRGHFHEKIVTEWVRRRAESPVVGNLASEVRSKSDSKTESGPNGPLSHLEKLIGGTMDSGGMGYPRRRYGVWPFKYSMPAYSLPAEQLCGQLASAAEVVIAMPDRYPDLFSVFVASGEQPASDDLKDYLDTSKQRASKDIQPDDQRYADLRAQFMLRAQRSLDNLQISMGQRWRRSLTTACLAVSLFFGCMVVDHLLGGDPNFENMSGFQRFAAFATPVVIVTIAGALIAPLAHDLTLALRSFRRP